MEVEEVLNSNDIFYTQSGNDFVIKCLNPNHEDSNPSLRVDRTTGIFNCFVCGFKGNIFKHFGLPVNILDIRRRKLRTKILDTKNYTVGQEIPKGAIFIDYPWRGISETTIKKFDAFKHPDFQDRIVFPLYDIRGKIVCFIGRHMDLYVPNKEKYKIYPINASKPVFPTPIKPINGRVIVVEGIFDALNLIDKGLDNVVCCFGTSGFKKDQLELIKIFNVTGIDILFDCDENKAGQNAAENFSKFCQESGLNPRVITLNKGTDPGDLTQQAVNRLKQELYD